MLLGNVSAKALAAVVLLGIEGPDALTPQLPFQVEDRGDLWLVKGTPHTDVKRELRFAQFHVFFRKSDAENLGLGEDGRSIVSPVQAEQLRTIMTAKQFAQSSVPVQTFEPWIDSDPVKGFYLDTLGGLINRPSAAIDYAYVLMQAAGPWFSDLPKDSLKAEEYAGVWHATVRQARGLVPKGEILSFSRTTGKLLSGGL